MLLHRKKELPVKPTLTVERLCEAAAQFVAGESAHWELSLYGVTDGKAVGTYFEHKFQGYLQARYTYAAGSSAKGIDFPDLDVDMKVTSITHPQSSCPFKSERQKIYGLGYSLLVFVYNKLDDSATETSTLQVQHVVYLHANRTADYQTTLGVLRLLENSANRDDLIAFLYERHLPIDDIQAANLAEEILSRPPLLGYLTISNALQWRLQYSRSIQEAGRVAGLVRVV